MATVETLLAALHDRTGEYISEHPATSEAAKLGWHRLALNAMRILVMTSPPADVTTILKQILRHVDPRDAPVNSAMTAIGYTLGVLADTVNSHPDTLKAAGHAGRTQLRSCILGTLHHVAAITLQALPADSTVPGRNLIRDLADATEAAAYAPWRTPHQPLAGLSLGPTPGSLDQAVDRWARCATDILTSPSRVTSYAFQRTAATIARVCFAAAAVLTEPAGERAGDHIAGSTLAAAAQAWQTAADWPPEVRLGGRTTPLRQRSSELDQALAGLAHVAVSSLTEHEALFGAVLRAERVSASYQAALVQVVTSHSLWVSVEALGSHYLTRHPGTARADWVIDPGTLHGEALLSASERAGAALRQAVDHIHRPVTPAGWARSPRDRPVWETITASRQLQRRRSTNAPGRSRGMGR